MTCQWCIHFRYKGGFSVCARPGGDGNIMPAKGNASECQWFDPRRICTTCSFRCSPDERDALCSGGLCGKWTLRSVSNWGGRRRAPQRPSESSSTTQKTEGANT